VVVPRFTVGLVGFGGPAPVGDVWQDTHLVLPEAYSTGTWTSPLTRQKLEAEVNSIGRPNRLPLAKVLRQFPVALMVNPSR
jgi:maltooligosyltrehalose synthase